MGTTIITGFWTFFCNPKYWAVDDFLRTHRIGAKSEYRITTWQKDFFEKGQLGVIRVGFDSRNSSELNGRMRLERGVYAVVEVTGKALPFGKSKSNFKIDHQQNEKERFSVPVRYIRNYINHPILLTSIEGDRLISLDRYLVKGIQAASMPLHEDAFNRILLYGEEGGA
ncbi:hypothetical protein GWC95_13360 [Sediminibacterium roseum]|uniref:Uncharacterized protein n=1 Tax=Sediminibacterium roseum TaxID=1978412 RepID=A0ABX0A108_9BACT|nr:hypothetical protein [Sediminibacterium roseum]NCI50915.1 hypothetical protein [Sediminibacterium roseum]